MSYPPFGSNGMTHLNTMFPMMNGVQQQGAHPSMTPSVPPIWTGINQPIPLGQMMTPMMIPTHNQPPNMMSMMSHPQTYMTNYGQPYGFMMTTPAPAINPIVESIPPMGSTIALQSGTGAAPGHEYNQQQQGHEEAIDDGDEEEEEDEGRKKKGDGDEKNILKITGNEKTMNLNHLIVTNIQQSQYFRVTLFDCKTLKEVIEEMKYKVKHVEPWERGSRHGSTGSGMCGGVRGVGVGGIISTPFCILFKLCTLKPTRKQVISLIRFKKYPFVRAIAFLYIRFTQHASTFWEWFSPFMEDDESFQPSHSQSPDLKPITISTMMVQLMTKGDWFTARYPRIPVSIQKDLDNKINQYFNPSPSPSEHHDGQDHPQQKEKLGEEEEEEDDDDDVDLSKYDIDLLDKEPEKEKDETKSTVDIVLSKTKHRSHGDSERHRIKRSTEDERHKEGTSKKRDRSRSQSRSRSSSHRDRHHSPSSSRHKHHRDRDYDDRKRSHHYGRDDHKRHRHEDREHKSRHRDRK